MNTTHTKHQLIKAGVKDIFYPGNVVVAAGCGCCVVVVTKEEAEFDGCFSGILIKKGKCNAAIEIGVESRNWAEREFIEADVKVTAHEETK